MNAYETILARIENTPELAQYQDLLTYDWDDFETDHSDWVATAETSEIVDWAEQIRDSEKQQNEVDEITNPTNW